MILRQNRNNRRLIPSEDLFFCFFVFRGHHDLARKSEEVGPPCFRETLQHFGGTCKPATVSKGYRSTKSLGNPALKSLRIIWFIQVSSPSRGVCLYILSFDRIDTDKKEEVDDERQL